MAHRGVGLHGVHVLDDLAVSADGVERAYLAELAGPAGERGAARAGGQLAHDAEQHEPARRERVVQDEHAVHQALVLAHGMPLQRHAEQRLARARGQLPAERRQRAPRAPPRAPEERRLLPRAAQGAQRERKRSECGTVLHGVSPSGVRFQAGCNRIRISNTVEISQITQLCCQQCHC